MIVRSTGQPNRASGAVGRWLLAAATCTTLFAIASRTMWAQILQSTGVDPTCNCRIVLHKVASLGDNEDAVALKPGSVIAHDAAGRFFAARTSLESSIAVFGADGKPGSTFGRQGEGPGELGGVRHARVTRGDSVLVMDYRKFTLFAPSGVPVRWGAVPNRVSAFRFAVLKSGYVVVNNYHPSHPSFILLNSKFALAREFGRRITADDRDDWDAIQYQIVGLDSGRFAAVRQYFNYEVEIWDTTGTLVRRFDRVPPWYRPWTEADKLANGEKTDRFPGIFGIHADAERLWIAARVPDPKWKQPAAQPSKDARGREILSKPISVDENDRRFDTVIEVLDMATGRVLVSQRFDALITQFTEGGLLYGINEAPSLLLRADAWRPEIVRVPK
ncbi:MAG: hypothetical protein ABJB74_08635 [Gemmatimonas sp.]